MRLLTIFLLLLYPVVSGAQENKAYLQDGKIMVQTDNGVKELDYDRRQVYSTAVNEKWEVKEQSDPVDEALKVFKKKGNPYYNRRIWLVDRAGSDPEIYIEFITDDEDADVTFSPLADYAYYLGFSPQGVRNLYGHNLEKNKKFRFAKSDKFELAQCDDNRSFVIVQQDGKVVQYVVYDLGGKRMRTFKNKDSYAQVQQEICQ